MLQVAAPSAGSYTLVIRTCNGSANDAVASHELSVNGGEPRLLRYINGGWDNWSNVFLNVELKAGVNSLRFTPRTSLAEIDCIDVIPRRD